LGWRAPKVASPSVLEVAPFNYVAKIDFLCTLSDPVALARLLYYLNPIPFLLYLYVSKNSFSFSFEKKIK
jgi:hypothetical protein